MMTEGVRDWEAHCRECRTCRDAREKPIDEIRTYCNVGIQLYQRAIRSLYMQRQVEALRVDNGPCLLCGGYDGDHDEGCPCAGG